MKKVILFLTMFLFATTLTFAQDYKYKPDPWDKEKVNILDSYGNKVGYYKVDAWDKSKINVYDASGNLVKTVKNDAWDDTKTNTYDSYGNKQSSAKQNAWNSDRVDITDKYGNVIGYRQADAWDKDKINVVLEDLRISFFAFFGTLVIFFSSPSPAHVMIKGLDGSLFLAFARSFVS